MIDEELIVQRALTLDLPEQSTDVRKELVNTVTAIVFAQRPPTEADLMAYFNAHRAKALRVLKSRLLELVAQRLRDRGIPQERIVHLNFDSLEWASIASAQAAARSLANSGNAAIRGLSDCDIDIVATFDHIVFLQTVPRRWSL